MFKKLFSLFSKNRKTNIEWSKDPGCYEQHLQRRHKNPLFPQSRRWITADEVKQAQQLDEAEYLAYKHAFLECVKEISSTSIMVGWHKPRETLSALIERGSALGGRALLIQDKVVKLYQAFLSDVHKAIRDQKPESLENLDDAIDFDRKIVDQNRMCPFLAQVCRQNSPITAEDMIPSFLSESADTMRDSIMMMGSGKIATAQQVIDTAMQVLMQARGNGLSTEQYESKAATLKFLKASILLRD